MSLSVALAVVAAILLQASLRGSVLFVAVFYCCLHFVCISLGPQDSFLLLDS